MMPARRLPAGAWWCWALALSVVAAQTFNALLLGVLFAVAWLTVVRHGEEGAMARFRFYLLLGAAILAMRVVFRLLLGGWSAGDVLFTLPEIPLPTWTAGVRLGGPVTSGELASGFVDGLRLAAIVVSIGAANALADPRRMLRSFPRALHAIGTAVKVAVGLAPQLVESAHRVRRATKARSGGEGRRGALRLVNPVIADALGRTTSLAVAMEVRGFGTHDDRADPTAFRLSATGVLLTAIGFYLVLDATTSTMIGAPVAVSGLLLTWRGVTRAGVSNPVTVYRPDIWDGRAWLVAASGVASAVFTMIALVTGPTLAPAPLGGPSIGSVGAVLVAAIPALGVAAAPRSAAEA